ncbi:nucleoside 2-deoxyribosyltransferase [Clostridium perfringens]|nr:nucleoside 2-deoxyribosyltransferase [Clostridium perfringens]MDM0495340.1 nucleoside 2-deoxyribosyltransferase [Clostridium perfringens]
MKKVYLASPFFNPVEVERVDKVKEILDSKGLEVFSPKEHQNKHLEFGSKEWRKATFKNDVDHIDWCEVVVAIISQGNYDDSGTAWELGYAYATNKPVILINLTGETINLMIADSLHALITSYDELKDYDFNELKTIPYENYVW